MKNASTLSFVVLHYMNETETIECVDTLLRVFPDSFIVVVDNASPNQSGASLQSRYEKANNITILINEENLGFARGNNVGIRYAKQFDADFVIVMNNDVLVTDPDFANKIDLIYNETHFSVLGPDVVTPIGAHQNPRSLSSGLCTKQELQFHIGKIEKQLHFFRLFFLRDTIVQVSKNIVKKITGYSPSRRFNEKRIINPVMIGCCYIFSREFVEKYDEVFYPETFMYGEEDILWYLCIRRDEVMVYDESISVLHKGGQSVKAFTRNSYKKRRFILENILNSLKVFLKLLDQG